MRQPSGHAAPAYLNRHPTLQRRCRHHILWPSWAALLLVGLVFPLTFLLPPVWQYAPFVVSLVLLGLPHGALDHLVLLRQRQQPLWSWSLLRVLAEYLAVSLVYLGLWIVAPGLAFAAFIGLTWFHWGQGEVHALLALAGARHLPSRALRALTLLVRGGLPMLVPLLAAPSVYLDVADLVIAAIGTGSTAALRDALTVPLRAALAGGYALLAVGTLAMGARHVASDAARRAWRIDVGETVLLACFFALVHPVVAVGLFFCCWHAPRHIMRLMLDDPQGARAVEAGQLGLAWRRFAIDALPMTAGALLLLGGLWLLVPTRPTTVPEFVGLYLVLIAVLTLPHAWVVTRMDRQDGIWASAETAEPAAGVV
ncbi:MAG: Brp/Blh family beta-carotene 15,15'-dioxygenase [Bacteroidota bacterium]